MVIELEGIKPTKKINVLQYDKLLSMRDRETKAMGSLATKLRLTNQARYTPQAAATASGAGSGNGAKV